eukprot:TRINITY_DN48936_c0_g1_i1.p1 TRINITY_DN48936_c0_g1~~TRINITY_DN48936_c0_g1_i1.p1  ORF type:complete len:448 (-),score=75.39 TRINITY_DN48936_c0_g1_i1:24-1283(-)
MVIQIRADAVDGIMPLLYSLPDYVVTEKRRAVFAQRARLTYDFSGSTEDAFSQLLQEIKHRHVHFARQRDIDERRKTRKGNHESPQKAADTATSTATVSPPRRQLSTRSVAEDFKACCLGLGGAGGMTMKRSQRCRTAAAAESPGFVETKLPQADVDSALDRPTREALDRFCTFYWEDGKDDDVDVASWLPAPDTPEVLLSVLGRDVRLSQAHGGTLMPSEYHLARWLEDTFFASTQNFRQAFDGCNVAILGAGTGLLALLAEMFGSRRVSIYDDSIDALSLARYNSKIQFRTDYGGSSTTFSQLKWRTSALFEDLEVKFKPDVVLSAGMGSLTLSKLKHQKAMIGAVDGFLSADTAGSGSCPIADKGPLALLMLPPRSLSEEALNSSDFRMFSSSYLNPAARLTDRFELIVLQQKAKD